MKKRLRRLRTSVLRSLAAVGGERALVGAAPPVPVREVFRRFWPYARPYRRWLWLTLLFVALDPAVDAAIIWLFGLVVDEVLVPRDLGLLPWIALAYLGLTLLGGTVSFFDDYLSAWVGERFLISLRTSFFRHLQGLSLGFFERRKLGDIISRLTDDVASIEDLVLSGVVSGLSYGFRLLFFLGALFCLQWELALVSLFFVPLFGMASRYFSRLIKEASREKRQRSGSISAVAEECLSNVALVQAYGGEGAEAERFHREGMGRLKAQLAATRLRALFTPLVDLIGISGVLVVIGVGTWELSRGMVSLGGLLAFLTYLNQLHDPVRGLARLTNTIYSASAGAERIIEFLEERPPVTEKEDAAPLARVKGVVEFEEVSFLYPGADYEALKSVSLRVEPGQALALVGPSGAGKTTVAKLLLRFYDPTAGRILLDGHDLRDLTLRSLREHAAVLLQETLVFDGTVRENIAYGLPGVTEEEIVDAAKAADIHEFIASLPEGYDTVVGQKGRRFSGGQRQRVAIARAMIRDAPILILDEPTTGLDAGSAGRIMEPLGRLMHGRATIIVSHDLATVRKASSILVLEGGHIVECGTHAELMALGGSYARLYLSRQDEAEPCGMQDGKTGGSKT